MEKLEDIFDIRYGNGLELINCEESNEGIPFISRTSANNGMMTRVKLKDDIEPMPPFAITVALGGSVLSSFVQIEEFYTSFHIFCLYPKVKLTVSEMLFYCTIIEKNKYRYNYGRQANKTLKDIRVPSIEETRTTIESLDVNSHFSKQPMISHFLSIDINNWHSFKLKELFKIYTSKDNNLESSSNGFTPYVSASQANNGISGYVDNEATQSPNTMTVARNGSIGATFYHPYSYCVSPDDVRIFEPKFKFNKYIAIFLSVLIEKEKYRYAYGRKFGTKRMMESQIKLPVTSDGQPDWQWMEDYIKSLPYSANL